MKIKVVIVVLLITLMLTASCAAGPPPSASSAASPEQNNTAVAPPTTVLPSSGISIRLPAADAIPACPEGGFIPADYTVMVAALLLRWSGAENQQTQNPFVSSSGISLRIISSTTM